ncbi:MAG: lipid IV(A) 3-deoxy-D-manno-octulosonic acid transferase [Gammaproteobacteria bacterium]|nr:lipid IV(A) 3-deoxy-D-manno-octulosonic acid transferase [Gammaproteobacteria bacterium]MCP5135256.1 lipid IV(A) 3-deoxy-D-manno-octulosonic acid transferase [Gammaproteobacteria bacterium]
MRKLYTAVLYAALPLVLLRLIWRGVKARSYLYRWGERFGRFTSPALPARPIWVHAVSVGESVAAAPLIEGLLQQYPGVPVVVTTTTPTGSERIQALFGDRVFHVYAPYDLPFAVNGFLGRTHPRLLLLMETEIWPNLIAACHTRRISVVLANARMSERSAKGYRRLGELTGRTLREIDLIAAQTEADRQRFIGLGADRHRVEVTGSIKFDTRIPASLREQGEVLRRYLGTGRPVWIAASTHDGEDELVLDAFDQVRARIPDSLLVLVPRHPERFQRVAGLCRRRDLVTVLRSEGAPVEPDCAVYLGDTMGELTLLYAAADLAFVGGSLVPTGGHNVLEPAALGLPVLVGPHTFNFAEIVSMLLVHDAAREITDSDQLAERVIELLQDANLRHVLGENGRELIERNRGALERLKERIESLM